MATTSLPLNSARGTTLYWMARSAGTRDSICEGRSKPRKCTRGIPSFLDRARSKASWESAPISTRICPRCLFLPFFCRDRAEASCSMLIRCSSTNTSPRRRSDKGCLPLSKSCKSATDFTTLCLIMPAITIFLIPFARSALHFIYLYTLCVLKGMRCA